MENFRYNLTFSHAKIMHFNLFILSREEKQSKEKLCLNTCRDSKYSERSEDKFLLMYRVTNRAFLSTFEKCKQTEFQMRNSLTSETKIVPNESDMRYVDP